MYGWYSEEAFKINKIGYLYYDFNNNTKLCTIISDENICPYYQPLNIFRENVIFQGELKYLICSIQYNKDNQDITSIESNYNRIKRFERLRS